MKLLGVTVLPEYIQSEGVDGVLDNLVRIGANAVATSPYLMEEADKETGNREPPADAGAGAVRLLDRPLFGKREVWVTTAPSFTPDKSLYRGLRYQPAAPTALTRRQGHILHDFIRGVFLVGALDIADDGGFDRLTDYSYPGPETPHPVGPEAQKRKIRQAQRDAGSTPVYVLAHGYGPVEDFRKRLEVAKEAGKHGYWVNRYAYLDDRKLDVIQEVGV